MKDRQAVNFFAVEHDKATSLQVCYINRPYNGSTLGISLSVMMAPHPPLNLKPAREALSSIKQKYTTN